MSPQSSSHHTQQLNQKLDELADVLKESQNIVVLTGAGISVASGIEPFRKSSEAIWERNITEMATRRFFDQDPRSSWLWYLQRFDRLQDKEPNPAHFAINELAMWANKQDKDFTLVTQNIDTLHRKSGSSDLIEIHGHADVCRCINPECDYAAPRGVLSLEEVDLVSIQTSEDPADLPRCPACRDLVRPHVLWFDEFYTEHDDYQFERAMSAFHHADLFLCSGTSFSVGITSSALYEVQERDATMWSIDPSPEPDLDDCIFWVEAPSEIAFPRLLKRLKGI